MAPSGIGKSALVRRFLDQLSASGDVVILRGRCYEQETVPYKALDGVIDSLSGYLALAARERKPSALLPRDVLALSRLFPVMLAGRGGRAPARRRSTRSPIRSSCGAARSPRCANC